MKKRTAGVLVLLFALTTAVTGCSKTVDNAAEAINVGGVSVPLGEVNFYLRYQQTQMQGTYGMYFGEEYMNQDLMGTGTVYGNTVRDTVVETLSEYYVVEANANDLGIPLTEEEKNKAAEAAKAFIAANNSATLKAMSADEATVTHVLELMALRNKAYDNLAATIDTEVDPEEAAQKSITYVESSMQGETDEEGNETELTEDELAAKKADMEEILAKAKESGDLKTAAEEKELTASDTSYGKDDDFLDEAVFSAADALADGEFSDVIETEDAYYIVYMQSTYDEEATQNEIETILSEREQEAYSAWYDPLEEAAEITTNDEVIETLTFERIFDVPEAEEEEETQDTDTDGNEEQPAEDAAEGQDQSQDAAEEPEESSTEE